MQRAYVFIEVEVGRVRETTQALRELAIDLSLGIKSVDSTTGPFDIVVVLEATDMPAAGAIIVEHIAATPNVMRTQTCLAVNLD